MKGSLFDKLIFGAYRLGFWLKLDSYTVHHLYLLLLHPFETSRRWRCSHTSVNLRSRVSRSFKFVWQSSEIPPNNLLATRIEANHKKKINSLHSQAH
ncbi:hypothetical protein QN277_002285 [Acacia crassicarpa]|uniref:Uncharacterized protein n=1 Tax=Acacia crassicarpa TaxID=499986 RepID=A0AAE1N971_9FABA|nr:hypothetical protein QN277_002285 [Acacia crassicarpa]